MSGWRLYADMGNTNLTWGVWDGASWLAHGRLACAHWTHEGPPAGRELAGALAALGLDEEDADGAALVTSTETGRADLALEAIAWLTGIEGVAVLGRDMHSALPVLYREPAQVGQDRLALAEGALAGFGSPVIALGFGSCITAQAVTEAGEFVGGAICPGLPAMVAGVRSKAPHLGEGLDEAVALLSSGAELPNLPGSTAENLAAGLLASLAGTAERLAAAMRAQVGAAAPVVATGGDAALAATATDRIEHVSETLVLDGLRSIDDRRRAEG